MVLVLLLFMQWLVLDSIIVIPLYTTFLWIKRIYFNGFSINARSSWQNCRADNILPQFLKTYIGSKLKIKSHNKIVMLPYKSYYNIALSYFCELINKKESCVNTRLWNDHHQLIMPPISKECSSTFLEGSFFYAYHLCCIWMEQIEWTYQNIQSWLFQEEC